MQAAQQLRQQRVLSGDLRVARAHAGRAAALWEHCAAHADIKSVRTMVALARAAEPEQRVHGAVALRSVTLLSPTAAQLVVGAGGVPPPPRTKWTRRVPHPVLIGHAASLTPY